MKTFSYAVLLALSTTTAAAASDDVSIMLDWLPSGWHSALLYGVDNGCFSERDMTLTLERGMGGADAVAKVAAGSADFGMADFGTMILAVAKGEAQLKALMPVGMNSPFGIMSLEAKPINSLQELEGKTLAAGPGDSNIKVLPHAMELAGADFAKVKFESADFSALLGMLMRDKIDSFTTFKTTGMILAPIAKDAGQPVTFYHYGKELDVYGPVIFTSAQLIEDKPDLAKRFTAAAECSYLAARENPQGALEALLKAFPDRKAEAEMAGITAGIENMFDPAVFDLAGFDWIPARVQTTLDFNLEAEGINHSSLSEADVTASFD